MFDDGKRLRHPATKTARSPRGRARRNCRQTLNVQNASGKKRQMCPISGHISIIYFFFFIVPEMSVRLLWPFDCIFYFFFLPRSNDSNESIINRSFRTRTRIERRANRY